jgi:hypothetical protein
MILALSPRAYCLGDIYYSCLPASRGRRLAVEAEVFQLDLISVPPDPSFTFLNEPVLLLVKKPIEPGVPKSSLTIA